MKRIEVNGKTIAEIWSAVAAKLDPMHADDLDTLRGTFYLGAEAGVELARRWHSPTTLRAEIAAARTLAIVACESKR